MAFRNGVFTTANTVKREDTSDELRGRLIQLVHDFDHNDLYAADRFITYLQSTAHDPLLRVLYNAPYDDEPETPEERTAVEEAREAIARGECLSDDELRRELGLEPRG
ncbi:hypothetical protein BH23CHL1_BH23CHL1_25580 [soil metagenome]